MVECKVILCATLGVCGGGKVGAPGGRRGVPSARGALAVGGSSSRSFVGVNDVNATEEFRSLLFVLFRVVLRGNSV